MTWRQIVVPFAVTRALLLGVALLAAGSIPYGVACAPCDLSSIPWLNALTRWDGEGYLSIARDGYSYTPGERSNITFSPLLPLLMRGLAALLGRSDDDALVAAGILAANAALLGGLVALVALGRLELDEGSARRAALYVLVFPTTVFLSALYPESLFLATSLAALYASRRGRWQWAAALGALAALARPFGVLIAAPLALALPRPTGDRAGTAAVIAAPVGAFAAWQWHLYQVSGDPLAFIHAQGGYGRRPALPFASALDLFDPTRYADPWLVLAFLVVISGLVVASWRMLHPSTALFGTLMLIATVSSGTVVSFPRYALAIFPSFLVLGALGRHRALHLGYLVISVALATLLVAMFAAWYWVA